MRPYHYNQLGGHCSQLGVSLFFQETGREDTILSCARGSSELTLGGISSQSSDWTQEWGPQGGEVTFS